jgi:hypothetical protein
MKIKDSIKVALVLSILYIFLGNLVSAQSGVNDSETAFVTVTISSKTMIDITPANFAWTVDPGEACGRALTNGACNETSGNFIAMQIENIGSWNISKIWFNSSHPTQSPFGTGHTTYTDSGNYVVLSANESSYDFYFVARAEYNVTRELVYITDPDGNMPPNISKYTYGRLHNGSMEYFWFIDAVYPTCNASTYIRIGKTAHSKTSTGSVDFSNGANYDEITPLTKRGVYALGDINTGPLDGYSVAITNSTAGCKVIFSHWNKDYPFDTMNEATYAYNNPSDPLVPGDSIAMNIGVIVPYGIHVGQSNQGRLTVFATGA